jgi:hydrogenase maturation protease
MERIVVLGYGNTLRGDDGVGHEVVRRLGQRAIPGVEACSPQQLLPEHALLLAGAKAAIFVDARVDSGGEPVQIHELRPGAEPWGTHLGGPANLLALVVRLHRDCPRSWLVTVAGQSFGLGEMLTAKAAENVVRAVESVERLILGEEPALTQSAQVEDQPACRHGRLKLD